MVDNKVFLLSGTSIPQTTSEPIKMPEDMLFDPGKGMF